MKQTQDEIDYKVKFAQDYFNAKLCKYDSEGRDITLLDKRGNALLYIEAKSALPNAQAREKALAQVVLTNKKQKQILNHLALIYKENGNDVLEFIDLLDDSVMFNNDFHWESETPSTPTRDAIDRINDRLRKSAKIIKYQNDEIKEFYANLLKREDLEISITLKNMITIFHAWKDAIIFKNEIKNEQSLINLFLVDMLNNTKYQDSLIIVGKEAGDKPLIREGTNLSAFSIEINESKQEVKFIDDINEKFYTISNLQAYTAFWAKYKRPPVKDEFLKILEESHLLYTDKYRKDTGGEYTPFFFVSEQNKILEQYCLDSKTSLKDYIIYDPCCGVGNLENQFLKELKAQCYLSTLDSKDVDICKIKDFENVVQFDYLANANEPKFTHGGTELTISEIVKREKKKLMVIMNPPYQNYTSYQGKRENKAISFFNKVLKLEPEVVVFYYMTESFMRDEIKHYINSKLKMYSHIFSTAKTFNLSDWSISQMIFSKHLGDTIDDKSFTAKRYEKNKIGFNHVEQQTYTYDLERPSLVKEIDKAIKQNQRGMELGNYSYLESSINLTNKPSKNYNPITTENLKYCLLSKGLNFNTHHKYFERNDYVLKGKISEIPQELFNDSIAFSLFYLRMAFTNKAVASSGGVTLKNYIMPFSAEDLGGACRHNDLNVLYPENAKIIGYDISVLDMPEVQKKKRNLELPPFDFREFLKQFKFSKEAQELFKAALEIFRYYHANPYYQNKDYNDSFYDITNAIMGKDTSAFKELDGKDSRITRTKTTKGTLGFSKNTLKSVIPSKDLELFYHFFEVRKILAEKINKELLDAKLLLWKRENIF